MYAITINEYGDESKLIKQEGIPVPEPKSNQVLIKVKASSVNPIDLMKREGYGKVIFEKQRKNAFPWILGSDFSGIIERVGSKVSNFKKGDNVWGCTSNANSGTHSEYVCIDVDEVTYKPDVISHLEAASLPYVASVSYTHLTLPTKA